MKKLLLTLCTLALLACSKGDDNDNKVVYDETKGYLTNLESVKHGIVGTWKHSLNVCEDSYDQWTFNKNSTYNYMLKVDCVGASESITGKYIIFEKDGKFYVDLDENFRNSGRLTLLEITTLTKTNIILSQWNIGTTFIRQ